MPQNFLACDREQVFLMPPDSRDWLPEGHLAWFVLASVEEWSSPAFVDTLSAVSSDAAERMSSHGYQSWRETWGIRLSFVRRVELYRSSGLSFARVAADLGVSVASLNILVKQAEIDAGEHEGLVSAEREELVALRRENRVLREEREY